MNTEIDNNDHYLQKENQQLIEYLPNPSLLKNKELDKDYRYSRKIYKNLIKKGNESFNEMMAVAKESEHPRSYEVLSGLMKNIADITEKLMILQKNTQEIKSKLNNNDPENTILNRKQITNNNVFIGSTSELQDLLKKEKNIQNDNKTI
jgi:hypothetical protein